MEIHEYTAFCIFIKLLCVTIDVSCKYMTSERETFWVSRGFSQCPGKIWNPSRDLSHEGWQVCKRRPKA